MSKYSSTGRAWMVTKNRVLTEHSNVCFYCQDYATQVDHVVPKSLGGTDDRSNLVACCTFCNNIKKAKPLTEALIVRMKTAKGKRMGIKGLESATQSAIANGLLGDVAKDAQGRLLNGSGYVNGLRSVTWIDTRWLDASIIEGDYQVDDNPTVYNNKTKPYRKAA